MILFFGCFWYYFLFFKKSIFWYFKWYKLKACVWNVYILNGSYVFKMLNKWKDYIWNEIFAYQMTAMGTIFDALSPAPG